MIEKYSCYEFEIFHELIPIWNHERKTRETVDGFVYKIYGSGCPPYDYEVIDSSEWFHTKKEAQHEAIEHIDRLENGEN